MAANNSKKNKGKNNRLKEQCRKGNELLTDGVMETTLSQSPNARADAQRKLIDQTVAETVARTMEQLFKEGRLRMEREQEQKKEKSSFSKVPKLLITGKQNKLPPIPPMGANSEVTIYERAAKDKNPNRESTSSEEGGDTSDEFLELNRNAPEGNDSAIVEDITERVTLAEQDVEDQQAKIPVQCSESNEIIFSIPGPKKARTQFPITQDGQRPSTSNRTENEEQQANEVSERLVREVELSRAKIYETPGNNKKLLPFNLISDFVQTAIVDENYRVVGAHVDSVTRAKIVNNEYMDFAKLIPRDRVAVEDNHRVQMHIKNGIPYYLPVSESGFTISSFSRW